jgi:hypothetical protein
MEAAKCDLAGVVTRYSRQVRSHVNSILTDTPRPPHSQYGGLCTAAANPGLPMAVRAHGLTDWRERYGRRRDADRLPSGRESHLSPAQNVGADGYNGSGPRFRRWRESR